MRKESWTCDICGNPTSEHHIHKAELIVGRTLVHKFDVCSTCYQFTPKGVFQKAFNRLFGSKVEVKK